MILSPRDALLFSIATLTPEIAHSVVPIREHLLNPVILRDYQLDILRKVAALMRQGFRRVLIQLPTGGGKTVLAGQALLSANVCGFTAQFVVHRKELINQTSESFERMGLDHGFIAAGRPLDLMASTTLAGVQTLANRLDVVLPPNLVVVDEAHHAVAGTWERVMDAYPDAFILGLTATPERLDGRGLGDHFDVMVVGPSVAELIERGFLSPYDYYAPSRPDTHALHTLGGDFNKAEASELMDRPELIGDTVEHYLRLAKGEQGIVFAASREHSRNLAAAFVGEGVRAAHVDGTMDKERARIDAMFRAGDLDIMTNVDLFGEGYDVPGIVYCGLARPTKSLSLFMQQCGRALRPAPGKSRAIICDHASNVFTHLFPDEEREWTLEGRTRRKRGAVNDDADPVRQCLTCFRVYPSIVKTCPGCGTEHQASPREIKIREGQLEKLEREMLKKKNAETRKAEEKACVTHADFLTLAVTRGYENPGAWARLRMNMKSRYAARFR